MGRRRQCFRLPRQDFSDRFLEPIRMTGKLRGMSKETTAKRTHARTPNNKATTGFRMADDLWALLEPSLPVHANTHLFGGNQPRVSERRCADAIFSVLRTGDQCDALNETALGATFPAHNRFSQRIAAGVFLQRGRSGANGSMHGRGSLELGCVWRG